MAATKAMESALVQRADTDPPEVSSVEVHPVVDVERATVVDVERATVVDVERATVVDVERATVVEVERATVVDVERATVVEVERAAVVDVASTAVVLELAPTDEGVASFVVVGETVGVVTTAGLVPGAVVAVRFDDVTPAARAAPSVVVRAADRAGLIDALFSGFVTDTPASTGAGFESGAGGESGEAAASGPTAEVATTVGAGATEMMLDGDRGRASSALRTSLADSTG